MRGLKALVIGMGVLIVIGFVVIVVTLVNRSGLESGEAGRAASKAPVSSAPYQTEIEIPAGARITGTAAGNGRLIIHLTLRGGATGTTGSARLLIIDPNSGRKIGVIDLPRAKP